MRRSLRSDQFFRFGLGVSSAGLRPSHKSDPPSSWVAVPPQQRSRAHYALIHLEAFLKLFSRVNERSYTVVKTRGIVKNFR